MKLDLLKRILNASVYDVAVETPLEIAPKLSKRLGNTVWLKREDTQSVFSFKIRGAYQKMASLSSAERERGVIAASAGNHAQGVAYSARTLHCQAVICMPTTTPAIKINAVKAMGGEVVSVGASFDEAAIHAHHLAKQHGYSFVHPFDDWEVIAGQGTVGMEMLRQLRTIHAVFIPVGGGGLIAGIAAYIKAVRPDIRVIGVEPEDAACMTEALKQGVRVMLPHVGRFADGVAVRQAGERPFAICQTMVDEMITVSTDEICAAVKDVFEDTRSILEPAGALAIAGLKAYCHRNNNREENLVAIASGANTDFDRLRFIADRAEVGEKREALFAVTIPEAPGSYLSFCQLLGKRSVTEFNYRMSTERHAHIFVGVGIVDKDDEHTLMAQFHTANLPVINLTDNDLAKTHLRHMVGGHSSLANHERLYRFEFPEAPGALIHFLEKLSGRWNISLFHYRANGGVVAEVLAGFQVPRVEWADFESFLSEVGYPYVAEEHNPAYQLFLQGGKRDTDTTSVPG